MISLEEVKERELKLIERLRLIAIPYGEVLLRLIYQDGVVVLIKVVDKEETIKL